jgi:hypothetical protein
MCVGFITGNLFQSRYIGGDGQSFDLRLLAVTAMLVCYALDQRSPWFILAFAVSCAFGFLQGAWPFGLIEAIWALVALRRWHRARSRGGFRRVR